MTELGSNLQINADRLWDSIHELAEIGPGVRGGSNRQTLTDADAEGRRLFQKWCEAEGCLLSQPSYNLPGEEGGRYCRAHQQPGMVHVPRTDYSAGHDLNVCLFWISDCFSKIV